MGKDSPTIGHLALVQYHVYLGQLHEAARVLDEFIAQSAAAARPGIAGLRLWLLERLDDPSALRKHIASVLELLATSPDSGLFSQLSGVQSRTSDLDGLRDTATQWVKSDPSDTQALASFVLASSAVGSQDPQDLQSYVEHLPR